MPNTYELQAKVNCLLGVSMNTNPCKVCNTSDRYKSGKCKKCSRERCSAYRKRNSEECKSRSHKYYLGNKEKIIQRVKDYATKNRERIKQKSKDYHVRNREMINKKSSEYRKNNPNKVRASIQDWCNKNRDRLNRVKNEWVKNNIEKVRVIKSNNRAFRSSVNGVLSKNIYEVLMDKQKGKCIYCMRELAKSKVHIDHIMPLKLGGENIDSNVQLLCQPCNNKKSAKHPIDFAIENGYLL